ncbi:hypothetical protein RI537_19005 [Aeromonas salmonicida]|uniref:hypothetical protein n=1 Tax=Aeromonas salmonicida TaxID=645 RepID=UPI0034494CF6
MHRMKSYNKRVWLNKTTTPSTGSVVCYFGPDGWDEKRKDMFVEIASCHNTARLHKINIESEREYINKVKKLRDELTKYIDFLDRYADQKY